MPGDHDIAGPYAGDTLLAVELARTELRRRRETRAELTDFEITDPNEPRRPVYDEDDESDLDDEDDYWSGSATNVPRPGSP